MQRSEQRPARSAGRAGRMGARAARCRRAAQDPALSEARRRRARMARRCRMPTTRRQATPRRRPSSASAMTQEQWAAARWRRRAQQFGAVDSARRSQAAQTAPKRGQVPQGEFAMLVFRTEFAKRETRDRDDDHGARSRRQVARRRLLDCGLRPGRRHGRNRRDLQVRVPGVRRRGDLESRQAEAGLPVLRHRVAGQARRGDRRDRRARSRRGAARHHRRRPRLEGRQAPGQVPELQRDLGVRSQAAGAELRVLRLGAARSLRGNQAGVPAGERAAVHGERSAPRAIASGSGTASCGSRPTRSSGARSPIR